MVETQEQDRAEPKRVMVWGGTRGLGKEIARASVRRGHVTWVTGRCPTKAMEDPDLAGIAKCDYADFGVRVEGMRRFVGRDFHSHSLNADILFWVAGHWLHKPFPDVQPAELRELMQVHLLTPVEQLLELYRHLRHGSRLPHLVVVASSSAWKTRSDGQAAYGAVQAAKVQFARNLHAELSVSFPDLLTTIVRPGGMRTEFFGGTVDTSGFADPAEVAEAVWSRVDVADRPPLLEMDLAQREGRLVVECAPSDPRCP